MTDQPDPRFWLEAMCSESDAFRAAVAAGSLSVPVPSCPDWTVEDLLNHLAGVYRRVRRNITGDGEGDTHPTKPNGDSALAAFDDERALMIQTLEGLDPDDRVGTWGGPRPGTFWLRRMAVESAVHRWDAQLANGTTATIEVRLATDGIDEVLDSLLPAGLRKGPSNLEGVVRLAATDTSKVWVVRMRGKALSLLDTNTVLDPGPGAQAAAEASASDLLLALWGRIPYDTLTVTGDADLLTALRTG